MITLVVEQHRFRADSLARPEALRRLRAPQFQ